jgi:hypothetical protein
MAAKIPVNELIAIFKRMYDEHWKYTWGHAAEDDVDCSGAFVWAYEQFGLHIYHGSNAIARQYVVKLLPVSQAKPGMAAFKIRKPGQAHYDLPAKYQPGGAAYNGDLNDYYHIGLVDETGKNVYNAQSPDAGFGRSAVSKWAYVAELKAVNYGGEVTPVEPGKDEIPVGEYKITAQSGKTVRIRKGPSKNSNIVYEAPVGDTVKVLASNDGWATVEYTVKGYMMTDYLIKKN